MFTVSRVIAIDDERKYLDQLCASLHGMGIPCIPIQYTDELPGANEDWLGNVRILFCDLHLIQGVARPELNYPVIGSLLEKMVSKKGSPLLLILWTAYAGEKDKLRDYLLQRHPDAMPIEILALSKEDFREENAKNLPEAIRQKLNAIPQLRALYEWEDAVATAGSECVGDLVRLAVKRGGDFPASLDEILTTLAQAATGKELAAENPGAALQDVLIPVLADRLSHLPTDAKLIELWKSAMPSAVAKKDCEITSASTAAINTALHVFHAPQGVLTGRERGAVVRIDCPTLFMYRFANTKEVVANKFCLKDGTNLRWVAIQVEAACDYANQKSACIPFVLAAEVPFDNKPNGKADSIWTSPAFLSERGEEVRLVANVRYVTTISPRKAKLRSALYRLRESIVNELAFSKSRHESRLGIVKVGA